MIENTKYMLTTETLTIDNGVELKRIIALKDFGKVKKRRPRGLGTVGRQPRF